MAVLAGDLNADADKRAVREFGFGRVRGAVWVGKKTGESSLSGHVSLSGDI